MVRLFLIIKMANPGDMRCVTISFWPNPSLRVGFRRCQADDPRGLPRRNHRLPLLPALPFGRASSEYRCHFSSLRWLSEVEYRTYFVFGARFSCVLAWRRPTPRSKFGVAGSRMRIGQGEMDPARVLRQAASATPLCCRIFRRLRANVSPSVPRSRETAFKPSWPPAQHLTPHARQPPQDFLESRF